MAADQSFRMHNAIEQLLAEGGEEAVNERVTASETQEISSEDLPVRDRAPRSKSRTISIKRMPKRELERSRLQAQQTELYARPSTRGECIQGENSERPCPFVSCKHHLYLDVNDRTGSIKLNFPELEVWDLPETCALDIADRGGTTLEDVGVIMNLTRERIRQLETQGLTRLKALSEMAGLQDYSS